MEVKTFSGFLPYVLSIIETVALRNRTGGKLEPVTPVGAIPMSTTMIGLAACTLTS